MLLNQLNRGTNNLLKGYNYLLYFAGSMVTYEPTDECVTDFWKKGLLKRMPLMSNNPRFITAMAQLRESCKDQTLCSATLKKEYQRLFGMHSFSIPLLASHFTENQEEKDRIRKELKELYDAYGWNPKLRIKLSDDHLGIEVLFLTKMIDKLNSLDDEPCRNEMRNQIIRFTERYMLPWIGEWNQRVQESAESLCYKGTANLLTSIIEDVRETMVKEREK